MFKKSKAARRDIELEKMRISQEEYEAGVLRKKNEIEAKVRKIALTPVDVTVNSGDDIHSYGIAIFLLYIYFYNDSSDAQAVFKEDRAIPQIYVDHVVETFQKYPEEYDVMGTSTQTVNAAHFVTGVLMTNGVHSGVKR